MFLLACTSTVIPTPQETGAVDSAAHDSCDSQHPEEIDIFELPTDVPTLEIRISDEAMARLDADPYQAPDEVGQLVDELGAVYEADLSYRGAYQLRNVMSAYGLRNWKVKVPSDQLYLGRREWNFNYEPHLRQKLAYDLFRFAGVPVPSAQHVLLLLNGEPQGVYLRYEDPDDKRWLEDSLGEAEGDLYKAATDLPGVPQCFADLTVLGERDEDYFCHYQKKTNTRSAPEDYSALMDFVEGLADGDTAWFEDELDVPVFLSFLVVSNFVSNWDSYPQRPKNYWLYQGPERFTLLPWDLDGTFGPNRDSTYNQMGVSASVLYEMHGNDYAPPHEDEGDERPLVHRLMADPAMEQAYLDRYRELQALLLNEAYLSERSAALTALLDAEISTTDRSRLSSANESLSSFVSQRTERVAEELEGL